jgi:hypothetical protein
VVEGGDYSTDEQAVMVNDNGTLRQKKWTNNKPIYRMSFDSTPFGNLNGLAGETTVIKYFSDIIPNIEETTDHSISLRVTNISDYNPIGGYTTASGNINSGVQTSLRPDQSVLYFRNNRSTTYPASGLDVYLKGWIEYTKSTD